MDNNAEDCPVCFTIFDDTLRRPRTLPCGHAFCTICLHELTEQGEVTCPTCRLRHVVPEAGQFPVSYVTEALVKRLRGATLATPPPKPVKDAAESAALLASERCQERTRGLSRQVQCLLREQEAKVLAAIHTCQEIQGQLQDYQTTLVGWGVWQQHLEDQLQALVTESKNARVLVRQEESQVAVKREEQQQGEQHLHAVLQKLRTISTRAKAYEVIDNAEHHTYDGKQRVEECRAMFPDVHTVNTITKVKEASSAALEAAKGVQAAQETAGGFACAAGDFHLQAAPASSITDRLKTLLAPSLKVRKAAPRFPPAAMSLFTHNTPLKVEVEDLRSLTQPIRNLLQDGLVFAVHHAEGQNKHGRISLKDGRLHLHSLQDQPPPPHAVTVQMDQVVPATPPCLVFLDLAWPGRAPRRVLIHLARDTTRGRQFILLCTGQRGASYANTKMFKVDRDESWWGVVGGDYEYNNGEGGAALLPRLNSVKYRSSCQAGDVNWWSSDPPTGTQFIIVTKVKESCTDYPFGKVVDGLEVVVAAYKHRPITEVTVVDCGVVLWSGDHDDNAVGW